MAITLVSTQGQIGTMASFGGGSRSGCQDRIPTDHHSMHIYDRYVPLPAAGFSTLMIGDLVVSHIVSVIFAQSSDTNPHRKGLYIEGTFCIAFEASVLAIILFKTLGVKRAAAAIGLRTSLIDLLVRDGKLPHACISGNFMI